MTAIARLRRPAFWVLLIAGPVIWFMHFMAVYLMVEAACTVDPPDTRLLGRPILSTLTLGATVVAVIAAVAPTTLAYRRWRNASGDDDWMEISGDNSGLAYAGFLLGVLSVVAIGFVGLPAAFLDPC